MARCGRRWSTCTSSPPGPSDINETPNEPARISVHYVRQPSGGRGRLSDMLNDLRYALRTLRMNRLFAAMAMLSLALGIGANTAIYSFMDAILVRTLPVHEPGIAGRPAVARKGRTAVVAEHQRVDLQRCRAGPRQPQPSVSRVREPSARTTRCCRRWWHSTAPTG